MRQEMKKRIVNVRSCKAVMVMMPKRTVLCNRTTALFGRSTNLSTEEYSCYGQRTNQAMKNAGKDPNRNVFLRAKKLKSRDENKFHLQ